MYISVLSIDSLFSGFVQGIVLALSNLFFFGGMIAAILYRPKLSKLIHVLLSLIGCANMILVLWFYLNNGYDMNINVIIPPDRMPNNLTHDPSSHGNYSYEFLTYGSGFDDRIEYGKEASIITPTIDLSSLIQISSFNKKVFKYNESALPLNGPNMVSYK